MTTNIAIKKVTLNPETVVLEWSDAKTQTLGNRELRLNCSCAECVEEWTQRRLLNPASVPRDIRAEDYITVGRYAIQFLWTDGHYTGIYTFDLLRAMSKD